MVSILSHLSMSGHIAVCREIFKYFNQSSRHILCDKRVNGKTILSEAVRHDHKEMVSLLVKEFGADIEQNSLGNHPITTQALYATPLWWCAANGSNLFEMMKLLVDLGADINSQCYSGANVLMVSCSRYRIAVSRFLLDNGADHSATDNAGKTCLMKSVKSPPLCRLLLDKGANVNVVDDRGCSPLWYAISCRSNGAVEILMEAGADCLNVQDVNKSQLTCLQLTCQKQSLKMVNCIIQYLSQKYNRTEMSRIVSSTWDLFGCYRTICFGKPASLPSGQAFFNQADKIRQSRADPAIDGQTCWLFHLDEDHVMSDYSSEINTDSINMVYTRLDNILGQNNLSKFIFLMTVVDRLIEIRAFDDAMKYQLHIMHTALPVCKSRGISATDFSIIRGALNGMINITAKVKSIPRYEKSILEGTSTVTELLQTLELKHRPRPYNVRDQHSISMIITSTVKLLKLVSKIFETDVTQRIVKQFTNLQLTDPTGCNLLHLACGANETTEITSLVPFLLRAGADVNDMDYSGNTPLHYVCNNWLTSKIDGKLSRSFDLCILAKQILLHDVHVDVRNEDGLICSDILTDMGIDYIWNIDAPLTCLCARKILQCNIEYDNYLPYSLAAFVNLH